MNEKDDIFSSSFFVCGVLEHGIVDIFVCLEGNWIFSLISIFILTLKHHSERERERIFWSMCMRWGIAINNTTSPME